MKIVQINTVCGWGSTGRIVIDLAETLINSGHECHIAYGQKDTKYKNSYKIGTSIENHLHNFGSRLLDSQGYFSKNGTQSLVKFIQDIQPDIIHLHNLHGNYLNIKKLFNFLKECDIPIVWTLHDCWPFTGHCAYFDYVDCSKWETRCFKCPNKRMYPSSLLLDNSSRNYVVKRELFNSIYPRLTLVSPSTWLAQRISSSFLRYNKTVVINNGIDLRLFKGRDTAHLKLKYNIHDECVILGVSSDGFTGRKGLHHFLELSKHLDGSYRIVLVGISNEDRRSLNKNFIAINRTQSLYELSEFYSMADIFVNPTLEDNFPTTNLEALACGTPVITFNTGGSPEAIDGNTGRVVSKADSHALRSAIVSMGKRFKEEHSRDCTERANSLYDKEQRYKDYLSLYMETLDCHD